MTLPQTLDRLRTLLLWSVWLVLTGIWVATLWAHWRAGDRLPVPLALVVLVLLVVLYFAEGIELAATDLLDKEAEQLRRTQTRAVLSEIQARSAFFYAQRQVFVVVIISFMSLITAYSWIYVPFAGRTSSYNSPFWFSLVFTTLTVLWFSQVTPKRLAVLNSELFLAESSFVWRLIKLIGVLGLPNPSDWLVAIIERHSGYGGRRQLLPSRAAHYALAGQLEGLSLDRAVTVVEANEDGSGRIVKRMLVLLLHEEQNDIHGDVRARAAFAGPPLVTPTAVYRVPFAERLDSLAPGLDAIFEGREPGGTSGFSHNLLSEWKYSAEIGMSRAANGGGERATWRITGGRLPERYAPPRHDHGRANGPITAVLYEVEARLGKGGFGDNAGEGQWPETILEPCRSYSIQLRAHPAARLTPVVERFGVAIREGAIELAAESARYTELARLEEGTVDVPYPLHGGTYTLYWRMLSAGSDHGTRKLCSTKAASSSTGSSTLP